MTSKNTRNVIVKNSHGGQKIEEKRNSSQFKEEVVLITFLDYKKEFG